MKVDADTNVPACIDVLTLTEPVNCEPTIWDNTLNPSSGDTSALTDALTISVTTTSVKSLPLPLNPEAVTALSTWIEPLNMEPLSIEVTLNTLSSVEAVTLPLAINVDRSASSVSAERGISNNWAPLPLNEPLWTFTSPVCTFTSPKKVEPLTIDSTLNPSSFETDAVTEPVTNLLESPEIIEANASSDAVEIAANGISDNWAPLPLKEEPLITPTSPKKVEPLTIDVTMNPLSASTEAVTLPLTNIFDSSDTNDIIDDCASVESAEKGMSLNFSPLPLNAEPLSTLTSPKNVEPLSTEVTVKPSSGVTEAVIAPLTIKLDKSASGVSAAFGILNNWAPLPLNTEPDDSLTSPKKVEPLSIEVTMNPLSASTEAVTLPLTNIFDSSDTNASIDSWASVESAENGISLNFSPLPLNAEPLSTLTSPKNVEPLSIDVTMNPPLGETDAVTEADAINDEPIASCAAIVSAERGISLNFSPLPLNEPVCSWISPKKVEPLAIDVTINPFSASTEAVTLPLTNIFDSSDTNDVIDCCASVESAENGISNKFSPLPLNVEPLITLTPPLTKSDELNSALSVPSNLNPILGSTDAVTEPLTMNDDNNASGVNAAFGILNRLAPLPLKEEPLFISILPLIKSEPLICEPLSIDVTTNPTFSSTNATTSPSTILDDCSAAGKLNNWEPSPIKNDDETTEDVTLVVKILPLTDKSSDIVVFPSTSNEPVISTEPVNSCKSPVVLPNLFEPDENIIEEEIISTIISLATILLSTYKSPVTLTSPSISISPSNDEDTFTKNPVFGEIDADAEPLINWLEKGRLFSLEPSPSNEPENEPLNSSNCIFVINKRLPSISDAISATEPLWILPLDGIPKLGSASCNDRYSYLPSDTSCGRVTLTLPLNNWLI